MQWHLVLPPCSATAVTRQLVCPHLSFSVCHPRQLVRPHLSLSVCHPHQLVRPHSSLSVCHPRQLFRPHPFLSFWHPRFPTRTGKFSLWPQEYGRHCRSILFRCLRIYIVSSENTLNSFC